MQLASSSSSQYASELNAIGAATGCVSCGSAQNMRRHSAPAKVKRQLATGRRALELELRRVGFGIHVFGGIGCFYRDNSTRRGGTVVFGGILN